MRHIFKLINNSNIFNISLCGFLHSAFCVVVLFICLFVILSHTFKYFGSFFLLVLFCPLRLQSALVLCVLFVGSLWSHCCFMVGKCHSSCPDVFISVVIIAKVL